MRRRLWILSFIAVLFGFTGVSNSAPVEVGDVRWGRSLEKAQAQSRESGKPILILFQEVPGCAGCQAFGQSVLKEPLIVEAMEDLFVPLLIHNNKGGEDRKLLKQFGEPSWNFQVIRFFDSNLKELIPRRDRVWTTDGISTRMIQALEAGGHKVPNYLRSVADLSDTDRHKEVAFAMACFWVGEYELGKLKGVVKTEAGWYDGREVTRVTYLSDQTDVETLTVQAEKVKCARKVYLPPGQNLKANRIDVGVFTPKDYRKARSSHQKKQIERWSAIHKIPTLNAMQLTRANSWAPISKAKAKDWLSPRQRQLLGTL